jgi:alkylation response protein AidB-like acyl-CoA dehydrogenase
VTAFALTREQQDFAERVREIASGQLRALAEAGTPGHVNRELIKAMGDLGLLARLFPGQGGQAGQGGPGGWNPPGTGGHRGVAPGDKQSTAMDLCLLREALATQSTEAETALALQGLGSYPVLQSGQEEVVRRWLPAVAAGDAVAAFALTEPGAGSDAAALALRAEPDGPGWRLTGEKIWISNAPEADFYTVFARTTPGAGARGVSAFVVPADRPGLSGEHLNMISPHPIGRLVFDGVPVQAAELLGERDRGFRVAMLTLDLFRPSVGAFAVGMAQAATDAAVAHAGTRTAFGGPLKDQQAVSHLLAEMATRTEAARLLVYAAAAAYDASAGTGGGAGTVGKGLAAKSAMAKLFATETAQFVVDAAVQIHGARALRRGHLLEHLYREVRAPRIYEGASEVQRTIIARELYR